MQEELESIDELEITLMIELNEKTKIIESSKTIKTTESVFSKV